MAVGLGTAQRQTGDPAFRDTLLDAARRAAELGDTERLVAAALANNRGMFSASGVIDGAKVEMDGINVDYFTSSPATKQSIPLARVDGANAWLKISNIETGAKGGTWAGAVPQVVATNGGHIIRDRTVGGLTATLEQAPQTQISVVIPGNEKSRMWTMAGRSPMPVITRPRSTRRSRPSR